MTDEHYPDENQRRILLALAEAWDQGLDGGRPYLSYEDLAEQLGMDEAELEREVQVLIDCGWVGSAVLTQTSPAAVEQTGYRQIECDWQNAFGIYCNKLVQCYALSSQPAEFGDPGNSASMAGYCSLEHANAVDRPPLAVARQMLADVSLGGNVTAFGVTPSSTPCCCANSSTPIRTRFR